MLTNTKDLARPSHGQSDIDGDGLPEENGEARSKSREKSCAVQETLINGRGINKQEGKKVNSDGEKELTKKLSEVKQVGSKSVSISPMINHRKSAGNKTGSPDSLAGLSHSTQLSFVGSRTT